MAKYLLWRMKQKTKPLITEKSKRKLKFINENKIVNKIMNWVPNFDVMKTKYDNKESNMKVLVEKVSLLRINIMQKTLTKISLNTLGVNAETLGPMLIFE